MYVVMNLFFITILFEKNFDTGIDTVGLHPYMYQAGSVE